VVKVENENLTVLREGAIPGRELIETWRGGGRGQY
jgi:hypothetical protein